MSSHLRNLVPALRQLLDVTVVRNWSFAQVTKLTKYQCLSASSYSSDTTDVIDGKATGELTVNNGGYGKSDERSAGRTRFLGKKIIQNKPVKLHRRKLTKEEVQEDASLDKEIGSLPPEDLFGILSKGEKSFGTRHDRPIYPRKYVHTETGKQPWQDNHMSEISASQRSKYRNKKCISQASGDSHASKTWGNTFGTLERDLNGREVYDDLQTEESVSSEEEYFSSEEEEERPYRRLTDNGRYSANWYGRQMRDFDRQGKVKEAIDVLDVWMLKNDRVRPNYYVFSMLISILGRAGYTKKAFQVFNQMKKMGVKPKDNTYTALFNACSNSPWHDDGLQRARNLQSLMAEKQHMPNLITYRAMIKAYGVCGDLRTAFALLDEASQRFKPDNRCFSVLLMACCSDKKAGFRHAVLVWRLMKKHGLKPDLYQYNLLLRAVRDCGIGDSNTAAKLIHGSSTAPLRQLGSSQLAGENVRRTMPPKDSFVDGIGGIDEQMLNKTFIETVKANQRVEEIPNSHNDTSSKSVQQTGNSLHSNVTKNEQSEIDTGNSLNGLLNLSNVTSELPSILEYPLSAGASSLVTVKLDLLATAEARLALIGGMSGILRNMADDEITPDVKTLSQLVNCIPDNPQAEGELIQILAQKKIQPDVDFFNMLIRKRNLRRDYVGAKELLGVIGEYKLLPNMTTFGCLAMGCRRRADGLQLLRDMQAYGLTPNQAIFTILIYNSSDDFQYKLSLLRQMKALDILPTDKMLMYIEKRLQISKQAILDQERGLEVSNYYKKDNFHRGYKNFLKFYGDWLRSTPVEKGEHPWSKFMHSREKAEPSPSEDEDDESFVRTV